MHTSETTWLAKKQGSLPGLTTFTAPTVSDYSCVDEASGAMVETTVHMPHNI